VVTLRVVSCAAEVVRSLVYVGVMFDGPRCRSPQRLFFEIVEPPKRRPRPFSIIIVYAKRCAPSLRLLFTHLELLKR